MRNQASEFPCFGARNLTRGKRASRFDVRSRNRGRVSRARVFFGISSDALNVYLASEGLPIFQLPC